MSLPSGYTQLEYIQSSGTQRINTNYNPTQNTRVLAKAYFNAISSSTTSYFFGAATSSKNAAYECGSANSKIGIVHNTTESRFTFPSTNPFTIDYNKNVIYFNGIQVGTFAASTFTSSHTLYIFDTNRNNAAYRPIPAITLYSFKIYTNDVLERDYVPCRNQSNEIGLYDVVNNIFYGNAGTGSFVAGAEVKGSHKTMIDGTGYDLKAGRCLVGGTAYSVKKGRVLVNGTGYDIPFSSGIPIGTLPVGSVVKIGVNGKSYDFLVVNQGIPSNSSLYDSSCDGTWMLMKNIYENRDWNSRDINKYESSGIHAYLNNTFLNLFDSNIRGAIKQVKIPYRKSGGSGGTDQSGANGLSAKIFLLSGYEVGWTTSGGQYFPQDGAKLSYFESGTGTSANNKRIAKLNGSAAYWWLRSPFTYDTRSVGHVDSNGVFSYNDASFSYGIRPAFTLPETLELVQNPDGTYTLAT